MLAWLKGHFWLGSFGKLAAVSMIAASLGTGCGDDPKKSGVAKVCTLNSECDGGLVCSAGLCHKECEETEDCPAGQRCIQAEESNVCQLDEEAACVFKSDCAPPLVCAADLQCRNECQTAVDCLNGQECADGVCAEPAEVDDKGGLKGAVDMGGGGEGGGPSTVGPGAGGEGGAPDVVPPTCTPGGACAPEGEPCKTGMITCNGNTEVCTVAGDEEDGTECGTDQVCSAGACVACTVGEACQPDANNVCAAGTRSCAVGPACDAAGDVPNGTECGSNQVCSAGACVGCVVDEACDVPNQPCKTGKRACANGPVCNASGNKGAGTECGTDQVCNSIGACLACVQDGPCTPSSNECNVGIMDCATGPNCTDTGAAAPDGAVCDGSAAYNFCAGGQCEACQNGNPCVPSGNPCHKGTLNCNTTPPTCQDTLADVDDGLACGDNKSCISGDCLTNDRVLTVTSAEPADVPIDAAFSAVTVKLVDGMGANVQGAPITVTASPGAYGVASSTNASGNAQVTGRVGRAIGTYTYTVSAPGATNVQFTVDAIAPTDKHMFTLVNVNHLDGQATVPGPGTISKLYYQSRAIAAAKDGTLYLGSYCGVYKLTPQGHLTRVAGTINGNNEYCTDSGDSGLGTTVALYDVRGLALDPAEEYLYIADYNNYRVMQLELSSGSILRFAGDKNAANVEPWGDDGPADSARLLPMSVQVAPNGDVYVGDGNSSRMRKIDAISSIITTAYKQPAGCNANSPLQFYDCGYYYGDSCHAAWNKDGKMFISAQLCGGGSANAFNGIARVDGPNSMTLVAGQYAASVAEGGVATSASFTSSPAIAFDKAGNLFLAARDDHRVRRIDALTDRITTVGGTGTSGFSGDYGLADAAQVSYPTGIAFDDANNLYFGDSSNTAVRGIWNIGATTAPTGTLATVAGTNQTVKVDAPFSALTVNLKNNAGNANISGVDVTWKRLETGSGLSASGAATVTTKTLANGNASMSGRVGLATGAYHFEASYSDIHGKAVTGSPQSFTVTAEAPDPGIIFPVVNFNHVSGSSGYPGPATYARLESYALGVAAASDGTIYVSDNCRVYEVTPRGEASILAGTTCGFSGDSGPANGAKLYGAYGLALDEANEVLYIADWNNQRIRMVSLQTGVIDTLAGGGSVNAEPFGDGGDALEANIGYVASISVGPDGKVYLADYYHNRFRVVDPATGFIESWLAGNTTCVNGTVSLYSVDQYGSVVRFDESGVPFVSGSLCQGTTTNVTLGIARKNGNALTRILGLYNTTETEGADAVSTGVADLSDFIFDANGDIVYSTYSYDRVRRVNMTTGKVNTLAGEHGVNGYSNPASVATVPGDYEQSTGVRLYDPWKLALAPDGHILIADEYNYAIRMIWQ